MAKSKIQFQKGYSLFEFLKDYGTEAQCENALFTWRFPKEGANKSYGTRAFTGNPLILND